MENSTVSKIYAVLSCDLVESASLSIEGIRDLSTVIYDAFEEIRSYGYSFWGRVVKGDSIECVFEDPNISLRVALLLKCYLKFWLSTVHSSDFTKECVMRSSIGISNLRVLDYARGIMDGHAVYIAGRNLLKMRRDEFAYAECQTVSPEMSSLLAMNFVLVDDLINELSAKQAIVIYHKLLDIPEVLIAKQLGISQGSVNVRASLGKWDLIRDTVRTWENTKLECPQPQ